MLLTSDGTALLADFGVALLAEAAAKGGGVVGSLPYMPPEQAAGAAVDARSDLYALGDHRVRAGLRPAALRRARAGAHPRALRPAAGPVRGRTRRAARALQAVGGCWRRPCDERPASAAEVERALAAIAAAPVAARRAAPFPAALQTAADRPFVGREARSRRCGRRGRPPGDAPALALVSGEAGIGKTTLAAAFARERNREGVVVLYGRCDEEPLISYQPFVEALIAAARPAARPRAVARPAAGARAHRARQAGARAAADDRSARRRGAALPALRGGRRAARRRAPPSSRCCSCSRISSGRRGRPRCCCSTSCARRRPGACSCSAPCGPRTARARIRSLPSAASCGCRAAMWRRGARPGSTPPRPARW